MTVRVSAWPYALTYPEAAGFAKEIYPQGAFPPWGWDDLDFEFCSKRLMHRLSAGPCKRQELASTERWALAAMERAGFVRQDGDDVDLVHRPAQAPESSGAERVNAP